MTPINGSFLIEFTKVFSHLNSCHQQNLVFLPYESQVSFEQMSFNLFRPVALLESPLAFLLFISRLFCSFMLFVHKEGKVNCALRQHLLATQQVAL